MTQFKALLTILAIATATLAAITNTTPPANECTMASSGLLGINPITVVGLEGPLGFSEQPMVSCLRCTPSTSTSRLWLWL
ncbi:hypothetical protein CPB84DRAFT_1811066 [Gymnopilus junonius]|uniref:Uncharacterized protein n=1 Tax=Gymnopilus junonius TaxID=109634 RepID=A0A9P5TF53_GYMJU|nr:hypothetical protein CPB84DRAFT_1811066 [Gymnopilus junonius]